MPGLPGGSSPHARDKDQAIDKSLRPDPAMVAGTGAGADPDVDIDVDIAVDTAREEPWTILVHNDDVTPYEFVVDTLGQVFSLSAEIAETVTWEAHSKGVAPVCSRPQSEAKRLINDAHSLARAAGYPLTFSMEPKL